MVENVSSVMEEGVAWREGRERERGGGRREGETRET